MKLVETLRRELRGRLLLIPRGHRWLEVEHRLGRIWSVVNELSAAYASERIREVERRQEERREVDRRVPVSVFVLGYYIESATERTPFADSQTRLIKPGEDFQFTFRPQRRIEPGAWMFVHGPAVMTDVRIGHDSQRVWTAEGTGCCTHQACGLGLDILCNVRAFGA